MQDFCKDKRNPNILELKKGHEKLGTSKCIYMYKNI